MNEAIPNGESRRCPGHLRHWFAARGLPGVVLDRCLRCGVPNPKWSQAIADEMERMGYGDEFRADYFGRSTDGD